MGKERREHYRFSVSWRGRVLLEDRSLYQVTVKDVSKGGVGIVFPHALSAKTPVNVEFYVPVQGKQLRIRAKTIVMHTTVLSDGRGALLGLKFSEMDKEALHSFNNALQELTDRAG